MWRNDEIAEPVYKCPVGSKAISKIILGLAISDDAKARIVKAARENVPDIPILQARKKHGELTLRFELP